ncbi:hypothetical protein HDV00_010782 [Rhizophlyctis rosea]|nr:hypothetical protein HDV00_010782 [Rhizophlyctis rosea]
MTPPAQEERTGKVPVAGKSEGKPEDGVDDVGAPVGRHDSEIEVTGDEDKAGDTLDELKALVAGLRGQTLGEFLKDSTDDGKEAVEECIKSGKLTEAIYGMVEGWKERGGIGLGPGGPKATLPNHVPWTHKYVDILAELMYLADSVNLDFLTLCGLFNKKKAANKAAIAERFIRYAKAEVDKAVKERDLRFSCWDWAQVYALEAFYDVQVSVPDVVLGVQGLKTVGAGMMVTKMKVPGHGLGSQSVAGGRIGRQGQGSGRQSRACGTGGHHLSGESKGVTGGTGSRNEEFGGNEEEDDYVI